MTEERKPECAVCVKCYTYNQASYIVDAMNGFTKQQTSFPYVCVIVDDASTDGESEVIRQYIEEHFELNDKNIVRNEETEDYVLFFAQHRTNKNCYFAILFLKYNHYCIKKSKLQYIAEWNEQAKYIAQCEGDDYWIDSMKLKKQYDFMESHPDYMLCFHSIKEIYEDRHYLDKIRGGGVEDREYSGLEWFKNRPSQYASFFMRRIIFDSDFYKQMLSNKAFIAGDIRMVLVCAHFGKIYGMSDVMSVYRHNRGGWTQKKRTDEQKWAVIKSDLAYRFFGEEYKKAAEYFAIRDCVSSFLSSLKNGSVNFSFLKYAISLSIWETFRAFYKILKTQYD